MPQKIVVHTPTQEDFDRLMRAYEQKGWKWFSGDRPTKYYPWERYAEKTCVGFKNSFCYDSKSYLDMNSYQIISVDEALQRLNLSNPNIMSSLLETFRKLTLSADDKMMIEMGLENPTGVPTEEGLKLWQEMAYRKDRAEVIEQAKKIKEEMEKK